MPAPLIAPAARIMIQQAARKYAQRKVIVEAGKRAAKLLRTTAIIVAGRKIILNLRVEVFEDDNGDLNTDGKGILVAGIYDGEDGNSYIYDCHKQEYRQV